MFNALQDKLTGALKLLRGKVVTEDTVNEVLKAVKMSLLEADVHFGVVKTFCQKIKDRVVNTDVLKGLNAEQTVIKIIHDELVLLMETNIKSDLELITEAVHQEHKRDEEISKLNVKSPFVVVLMVGLQGAGKTTTAAKLAFFARSKHKRKPFLVPADVYRPGAILQLKKLASSLQIPVLDTDNGSPVQIAREGIQKAKESGYNFVIIDTAGRLTVDEAMMEELRQIKAVTNPTEVLLVADAMTGQEAVNVAEGFNVLPLTGIILTKLDGDTRGGCALSMKSITGVEIKFVGVGEKPQELEVFHGERMASRILGMGDMLSLIQKTTELVSEDEAKKMEEKLRRKKFTLEDYLKYLQMIDGMGGMGSIMKMIPGMSQLLDDKMNSEVGQHLKRSKAIVHSMTYAERENPKMLNGSRKKRIASGCGVQVATINSFLSQFDQMSEMMSKMLGDKKGMMGMMGNMLGGIGGGGMPSGDMDKSMAKNLARRGLGRMMRKK